MGENELNSLRGEIHNRGIGGIDTTIPGNPGCLSGGLVRLH